MTEAPFVFILAGGRGERLWPLSSGVDRKPFLKLFEGQSLLELTLKRLEGFTDATRIRIVTAQALYDAVVRCVPDFPASQILCEPEGRNTAAAIAYACGIALREAPNAPAVVLPADHLIKDAATFCQTLSTACALAVSRQEIVTLGIRPTTPATTYGYIACGEPIATASEIAAAAGVGFTEKPDLATAKTYLATGNFLWNAGIFVWSATALRARFQADAPAFLPLIDAPETAATRYAQLPAIAFDYAIMEPCPAFTVVKGTFDWDDAGTLEALERHLPVDQAGNRTASSAAFHQASACTVFTTQKGHRVLLSGVHNLYIAQTPQVTLICPKEQIATAQKVFRDLPSPPFTSPHSEETL